MEQQEVKNFSSFNKSLTIMGFFVNPSSDSCLLCLCALTKQKSLHRIQGPTYPGTGTGQIPSCLASIETGFLSKLPPLYRLRHNHLSNPLNEGRQGQMVLLEDFKINK